MGARAKVRYVFTSSNTGTGFYTFIPELLPGIKTVYLLKGSVGAGKATFIRLLGESLHQQGYEVEFWVSALDPLNPEGLYIPQLDKAVVNGSLLTEFPDRQAAVRTIDLDAYLDKQTENLQQDEIGELLRRVDNKKNKAYNILRTAAGIKSQIKDKNSRILDKSKINAVIEQIGSEMLNMPRCDKHYFASALTADGLIDYLDELSSDCRKRYVFKGPEGCGQAEIIDEIAALAKKQGYVMDFYHCGIDRNDVKILLIRDLQIALLNTGNIEIMDKPWDVVFDMSNCREDCAPDLEDPKTDEVASGYPNLLWQAQKLLEDAQGALQDLKKIHARHMNFEMLNLKREETLHELTKEILDSKF